MNSGVVFLSLDSERSRKAIGSTTFFVLFYFSFENSFLAQSFAPIFVDLTVSGHKCYTSDKYLMRFKIRFFHYFLVTKRDIFLFVGYYSCSNISWILHSE